MRREQSLHCMNSLLQWWRWKNQFYFHHQNRWQDVVLSSLVIYYHSITNVIRFLCILLFDQGGAPDSLGTALHAALAWMQRQRQVTQWRMQDMPGAIWGHCKSLRFTKYGSDLQRSTKSLRFAECRFRIWNRSGHVRVLRQTEAVLRGDTELVRLLCSRSEWTAQSQETNFQIIPRFAKGLQSKFGYQRIAPVHCLFMQWLFSSWNCCDWTESVPLTSFDIFRLTLTARPGAIRALPGVTRFGSHCPFMS